MVQSKVFSDHVDDYEKWYEEYAEVYDSELVALREHFNELPENLHGIEVGLGTGRFSRPLDIKEGIEPSEAMAQVAMSRGIEIMGGIAERLPYADLRFDFVLFVTICHLDSPKVAFEEAFRVLKHKGSVIIGFLDRDQAIATSYKERGQQSTFYTNARFYTVPRISTLLKEVGFKNPQWTQTLFGELEDITSVQQPQPGTGEGSFVVVRAVKP